MVVLPKWVLWWGSDRALCRAADEVVRRCRGVVMERVGDSGLADGMSEAELRGYVRARAAESVDETIGEFLSRQALPETRRTALSARATDLLISQLVRDLLGRRFVAAQHRRVA